MPSSCSLNWRIVCRHGSNASRTTEDQGTKTALLYPILYFLLHSIRLHSMYFWNKIRADRDKTNRLIPISSAKPLPAFFAVREPSLLITTSELLIMRMLCPDRILPNRSGTGAASASWSGLKAGTLLLHVSEGLHFLYSYSTCSIHTHITLKRNQNQGHKQRSAREVHL